jgi:SSS family solute:Na+ symporter
MAWGIAALAFFWGRATPAVTPPAATPMARIEQLDARIGETFRADLDAGRLEQALPQVDLLDRLAREEAERSPEAARFAQSAGERRGEIGLVAMPWMLAATLPTGLLGLVVAGMLAASISTYAGYFLGWSAVIAQDVAAPLLGRDLSSAARLRLTRATVLGLTVFIMVWSLVYHLPGPAYFYLQVTANLFMAPTLVAVVGGLYWRRASSAGAILAFVLGALTSLGYLVPSLKLDVATAGNLSWALAAAGFAFGSLLVPQRTGAAGRAEREP